MHAVEIPGSLDRMIRDAQQVNLCDPELRNWIVAARDHRSEGKTLMLNIDSRNQNHIEALLERVHRVKTQT